MAVRSRLHLSRRTRLAFTVGLLLCTSQIWAAVPTSVTGPIALRLPSGLLADALVTAEINPELIKLQLRHAGPIPEDQPAALAWGDFLLRAFRGYVARRLHVGKPAEARFSIHLDAASAACQANVFKASCQVAINVRYRLRKLDRDLLSLKISAFSGKVRIRDVLPAGKMDDEDLEHLRRLAEGKAEALRRAVRAALQKLDRALAEKADLLAADEQVLLKRMQRVITKRVSVQLCKLGQAKHFLDAKAAIPSSADSLPIIARLRGGGCGLLGTDGPCLRDLFKVLGVARNSTDQWVRAAADKAVATPGCLPPLGEGEVISLLVGRQNGLWQVQIPEWHAKRLDNHGVAALALGADGKTVAVVQLDGVITKIELASGSRTVLGKLPEATHPWLIAGVATRGNSVAVRWHPTLHPDKSADLTIGKDGKQLLKGLGAAIKVAAKAPCSEKARLPCVRRVDGWWQVWFDGRAIPISVVAAARPVAIARRKAGAWTQAKTAKSVLDRAVNAALDAADLDAAWRRWLMRRAIGTLPALPHAFFVGLGAARAVFKGQAQTDGKLAQEALASHRDAVATQRKKDARGEVEALASAQYRLLKHRYKKGAYEKVAELHRSLLSLAKIVDDSVWLSELLTPLKDRKTKLISKLCQKTEYLMDHRKFAKASNILRRTRALEVEVSCISTRQELLSMAIEAVDEAESAAAARREEDHLVKRFPQAVRACENAIVQMQKAKRAEETAGASADMRRAQAAKRARERAQSKLGKAREIVTRTIQIFQQRGLQNAARGLYSKARRCLHGY